MNFILENLKVILAIGVVLIIASAFLVAGKKPAKKRYDLTCYDARGTITLQERDVTPVWTTRTSITVKTKANRKLVCAGGHYTMVETANGQTTTS